MAFSIASMVADEISPPLPVAVTSRMMIWDWANMGNANAQATRARTNLMQGLKENI
jgi:hypothetical protein